MKTPQEVFKEVLEELGFAGYKPNQMTNSDYWLCTCTAMERYATSQKSDSLPLVSDRRELLIKYQNWYWNEVQGKPFQTSASDIVDSFDE